MLSKLTPAQCDEVVAWINARLRSWEEIWEELEAPALQAYLQSHNYPPLDPRVRPLTEQVTLVVGGGHGGYSWKEDETLIDIDVFWLLPNQVLPQEIIGQLQSVLHRRLTPEIFAQQKRCTIPGIEQSTQPRRFIDGPKLGMEHNGVIWFVPSRCRHCNEWFYDGSFTVHEGLITHESCLG